MLDRSLTVRGASVLLGLFLTQFLVSVLGSDTANRWTIVVLSAGYVVLAVGRAVQRRSTLRALLHDGFRGRFDEAGPAPSS